MKLPPGFAELRAILKSDHSSAPVRGRDPFVLEAAKLLVDEPAHCAELARLYAERPDPAARTLIVDLLVTAGTDPAQAALIDVLEQPFAELTDPLFWVLFRRLALLERPNAEVAAFARGVYFSAQGKRWVTAAHTLGALIAGLARSRLEDAARNLTWILSSHLGSTSNPFMQTTLVQALGLARRRENRPLLVAFAGAPNLGVRRAAQEALEQLEPTRDTRDGATWMEDEDTLPCGCAIVDGRLVT